MPAKSEHTDVQSSPSENYFSGQKWQLQEALKSLFLLDHRIGIIEFFSRQTVSKDKNKK